MPSSLVPRIHARVSNCLRPSRHRAWVETRWVLPWAQYSGEICVGGPCIIRLSATFTPWGERSPIFFRLWNHVSRPNGTPQQVPNPCRIWPEIHEKWGPKSPKSLKIELWGPLGGSWGRPWSQNGRTRGSMSFFGPLLASFWSPNGSPKSSKIVSRGVPKCIVEKVSKSDPKRAPF